MKRLKDSKRIIAIILMAVLLFTVASVDVSAKWLNIPDCSCAHSGEMAVSHTDDCAEKQFYVGFCNNAAEDIFRRWALLPEDGREYILLYLSENDEAKYTQLYSMVESAWNSKTVAYDAQDPGVSVYASEYAFPNGTTITTEELTVSEEQQNAVMNAVSGISSDITVHGFCGTNITFTDEQGAEVQPSQAVSMKLKLNQSDSLSSANTVVVLHEGEDGLEVVGKVPIYGENTQSVAVAASGFSSYYSVLVSVPDNERSLAKLYNLNNGDRLGITKATDFYAYIGFTNPNNNNKKYLITYDANQTVDYKPDDFPSNWRVKNRVIGREISGSYIDSAETKDLWHFQLETAGTFTRKEVTTPVLNSYRITNVATGLSLDLYDENTQVNQPIDLFADAGNAASQRWFLYRHSNKGKYSIKLALNQDYSIHAYAGFENTNNNVVLHDFASAGSDVNELFDIVLDPASQNTISSLYQEDGKTYLSGTVSTLSDFYAYISFNDHLLTYKTFDNDTFQGATIQNRLIVSSKTADACKGDKNYLWHFTADTRQELVWQNNTITTKLGGSYKISNVGADSEIGKTLPLDDQVHSTAINTPVTLCDTDYGNAAQRWFINYDATYKKFYITTSHSNAAVLDVQGGNVSDTIVDIYTNGTGCAENQRFDIILADASEYNSGLMSSQLTDNDDYSIAEFDNVNLFDYDPIAFNNSETGNSLAFDGYQKYLSDIETTSLADLHNFSDYVTTENPEVIVDNGDEFYAYISYNNITKTGLDAEERCITYDDTVFDTNDNQNGLMIGSAPSKIQGVDKYLWKFVRQKSGEYKGAYQIINKATGKWIDLKDGTSGQESYLLNLSDGTTTYNKYWRLTYTNEGGGKFQLTPANSTYSHCKLDVADGDIAYRKTVSIYSAEKGTAANTYFNITIANKADDQIVNAGDHFYAYIGYRPEDKAYWVTHKIDGNQDKLCIGSGENLDSNYLWEFIREESDGNSLILKNSYKIRNVALYSKGESNCYVDLHNASASDNQVIKLYRETTDINNNNILAQRWYIKYNAAANRFYIASAVDPNFYFGLNSSDTGASTLTPNVGDYVSLSKNNNNSKQLFDLLIVNGQTGFGVSSGNTGGDAKYLSESSGYLENGTDDIATPGDRFYANIGFRPDDTPYWMTIRSSDSRLSVGGASGSASLDNNYLWEFIRTGDTTVYDSNGKTTTGLENSYEIVSVADPTKCINLVLDSQGGFNASDAITSSERNNTKAQRWFIKYRAESNRFYLASAIDQTYYIDVHQGGTGTGTLTSIQPLVENENSRRCKRFDLRIVTDASAYGSNLSELGNYTEEQTVTYGDRFYANIAYRPNDTSYWLTHKDNFTREKYNTVMGEYNGDTVTYHGLVVGSGENYTSDPNYLWEFIREESGEYENAYRIVCAAQPELCLEAYEATAQEGDFVSLSTKRSAEDTNRKAQLWYIKYHNYTVGDNTYKRFYLISAATENLSMDIRMGQTNAGTSVNLWTRNKTDNTNTNNKMLDFRIVTDVSAYGSNLSELGNYTQDQTVTPGDRFYANIGYVHDSTNSWLTHNENTQLIEYNANGYQEVEGQTYHGFVIGKSDSTYVTSKDYLWEFIREKSGTYKDAYRIVCAAQPELCLEVYGGDVQASKLVSLNRKRTADDAKRDSQLWYIKYNQAYNRFLIASAKDQSLCMDDTDGRTDENSQITLWSSIGSNGNIHRKIFDFRIVTDVSAYGLNSVTSSLVDYNLRSSGYPVITGSGVTGEELFNPSVTHAGKTTVAKNAKMQFIYNKKTGYYEYKSTANHAQYDKSSNTIKQYADTLGNYNYSSYDIPITASNYLDTSQTSNSRISLTRENGMLVGSVTERGPYIAFKNLNIQAYKARYISVKAYIGSNTVKDDSFIVYFKRASDTHYSEVRRFLKNYKNLNKSGWYEFVFDTATSPYWDGTITGLRVDFGYEFKEVSASNPYTVKLAQVSIISGETVQKIDPETYTQQESYNGISSIAADAPFKYEGTDIPEAQWRRITATVSGSDPQIQYNNLNINAAEVKGIVIQASIPRANITKNAFQLYFANGDDESFSDAKKFTVFYDKSQIREERYQLYFDLSKVDKYNSGDKWTGTIKKLRLDPLDFSDDDLKSSIDPQAFSSSFDIKIEAISLVRESNTADSAGAFLPLADIADSTAGQGNGFLKGSWESELNNTSVTNTAASRAIVNGKPQTSDINKSRSEVIKSIKPTSYDNTSDYHKHIINPVGNSDGSLTFTVDNSIESAESDPGLDYKGLNINASDVKGIRIKAKIPAAKITENLFQVFFVRPSDPGYDGDKKFTAVFTKYQLGEDGYYELYFDTSLNDDVNNFGDNWVGTISGIRLDPVDFQGAENRNPRYCPNDLMITIKSVEFLGYNDNADEEQESYDSLYFGMTMEHQFYLPTNKLDDKGQPIEFEYIGDDDLWVFIDGVLALDLGGCHTAQHGRISFTDGMAYINGGSATALSSKILETNTVHTLKLFYLERSGSTSSMMIRFNLPQASLTVKNNIECTSKLNTDQQNYFDEKANSKTTTYQLTATAPQGQEQLTSLYYRIGEGDAQEVTLTGGVGKFTLKNNETAAFTLPVGYSVKVEPIDTEIERFDYSKTVAITNGGETVNDQPQTTAQDKLLAYSFTNTYTMQRTDLTIEKQVNNQSEDENRTFIYHIKGNDDDPLTKNIDTKVVVNMGQNEKQDQLINLNANDWDPHIVIRPDTFSGVNSDDLLNITINVSGIPVGQKAMIYYKTDSSGNSLVDEHTIRVKKTDASDLVFNVKNVISKNGHSGTIQELRFDPMTFTNGSSVNENFKINFVTFNFANGTSKVFDTRTFSGFKECFVLDSEEPSGEVGNDMTYSVTTGNITVNNDSVKINGLPVGSYTVTEEKSWAWRHPIGDVVFNTKGQTVSDNGVTITLPNKVNNLLTFYNNTTYNKWLDGNSYKQNIFN